MGVPSPPPGVSMLRKLGNISCATSRAQCKLDQFAHATKMAAEDRAAAAFIVIVLLMEEDDERRTRCPDRDWIKRRREKGAFQNIVQELAAEDLPFFLHTGQLRFQFLHLSKIFHV